MLKTTKNITISGTSSVDGKVIAYMSATIEEKLGKTSNISSSIVNQELYLEHKEEVREDLEEFRNLVFSIEDDITSEIINNEIKNEEIEENDKNEY